MGISEAEQRVCELIALINCQLRLIRNLEECGKDLTSAKIVFDSLRVEFVSGHAGLASRTMPR